MCGLRVRVRVLVRVRGGCAGAMSTGDGGAKPAPQTEEEIKQALREREHALRLQLKAHVSSSEFNGRSTTDFYGFGKVRLLGAGRVCGGRGRGRQRIA
jgi:hypothetical protein